MHLIVIGAESIESASKSIGESSKAMTVSYVTDRDVKVTDFERKFVTELRLSRRELRSQSAEITESIFFRAIPDYNDHDLTVIVARAGTEFTSTVTNAFVRTLAYMKQPTILLTPSDLRTKKTRARTLTFLARLNRAALNYETYLPVITYNGTDPRHRIALTRDITNWWNITLSNRIDLGVAKSACAMRKFFMAGVPKDSIPASYGLLTCAKLSRDGTYRSVKGECTWDLVVSCVKDYRYDISSVSTPNTMSVKSDKRTLLAPYIFYKELGGSDKNPSIIKRAVKQDEEFNKTTSLRHIPMPDDTGVISEPTV